MFVDTGSFATGEKTSVFKPPKAKPIENKPIVYATNSEKMIIPIEANNGDDIKFQVEKKVIDAVSGVYNYEIYKVTTNFDYIQQDKTSGNIKIVDNTSSEREQYNIILKSGSLLISIEKIKKELKIQGITGFKPRNVYSTTNGSGFRMGSMVFTQAGSFDSAKNKRVTGKNYDSSSIIYKRRMNAIGRDSAYK